MSDISTSKGGTGAPAWVTTFADLMSLLMCFFVLLLSFSEMDVSKYKEMAGSLKEAFGVQRDIAVKEPPKGINVIAREFSPGRPEPTHLNVIRQMTTNDLRVNLDLGKERRRPVPTPKAEKAPDRDKTFKPEESARHQADRDKGQKAGDKADDSAGSSSGERAHMMPGRQRSQTDGLTAAQQRELAQAKALAATRLEEKLKAEAELVGARAQSPDKDAAIDPQSLEALVAAEKLKNLNQDASQIRTALANEIKAGSVDVETADQKIIIRVREKASFGSGSADLKAGFRPLLARVATILKAAEGRIIVAGHTDNVPINTQRFRSNWELSAARAVSVAHAMMRGTGMPSSRFLIQGFADTEPVASNKTAADRAQNRRVEIILQQGDDKPSDTELSAAGAPQTADSSSVATPPPAAKATGSPAGPVTKAAVVEDALPGTGNPAGATRSALGIRAGGR